MNADFRILAAATGPQSRLEDLLALANARYGVRFETVHLGSMALDVLQIEDLPAYIDHLVGRAPAGEAVTLPFWAKLWPAAFPLAMLASQMAPGHQATLLEVGSGPGLCGLAFARAGFKTLMTDSEPEAVLFCRAAILKNGLEALADAALLDISRHSPETCFDVIVASELLYLPTLHEPLTALLKKSLRPEAGAQALLSCDGCREAAPFFAGASREFAIQRSRAVCRSDAGESQTCTLYRLQRHPHA